MKKIKLLTPILGLTAMAGAVIPLASCSCGTTEDQTVKLTLAPESSSGIKVKESKLALNTDSTITLEVPNTKGIKVTYILVGTTRLEANAYSVEDNVITIKAAAMKEKNVELCVYAQDVVGLAAKTKTFEALETFKASDLTVNKVYEDKSVSKPLTWNTDYLIYDNADKEITDFDTVGYTFTRADARTSPVLFTIEFIHNDSITTDLTVKVEPLMEPESITVTSDEKTVFETSVIYPKDLNVEAVMAKDKSKKTLEWGTEDGYTVWDGDTEITDFGTKGYTFDTKGTKELTIKTKVPDVTAPVNFVVQPEQFKNTVYFTNNGEEGTKINISWRMLSGDFYFSKNNGEWSSQGRNVDLEPGDTLAIKGNTTSFAGSPILTSGTCTDLSLSGNCMGLLGDVSTAVLQDNAFQNLFSSTAITSVSANFLPATTLAKNCYENMFNRCTNLKVAPKLPATKLTDFCYHGMFAGCTSLETAPALPSEELASQCYCEMFSECTSLVNAPALPAKTLTIACYQAMFSNCIALANAPELPAETLANGCYLSMFENCFALKNAPALPSTTLTDYCYCSMFMGCTSLETVPELNAETLTTNCYQRMFSGCTKLEKAPTLPATKLAYACYYCMFSDCTSLTSVSTLPATELATACYYGMFSGCKKLQINNDGSSSGVLFFTCPTKIGDQSVFSMFTGTSGKYTADPQAGESYYWYQ